MNDQDAPQGETPATEAPQAEAQEPTPPPPATGSSESDNRGVMIVLSYLWILALIPLLPCPKEKTRTRQLLPESMTAGATALPRSSPTPALAIPERLSD